MNAVLEMGPFVTVGWGNDFQRKVFIQVRLHLPAVPIFMNAFYGELIVMIDISNGSGVSKILEQAV